DHRARFRGDPRRALVPEGEREDHGEEGQPDRDHERVGGGLLEHPAQRGSEPGDHRGHPAFPGAAHPTLALVTDGPEQQPSREQGREQGNGYLYAAGAFGWWAFIVPSYFKLLSAHGASPYEI